MAFLSPPMTSLLKRGLLRSSSRPPSLPAVTSPHTAILCSSSRLSIHRTHTSSPSTVSTPPLTPIDPAAIPSLSSSSSPSSNNSGSSRSSSSNDAPPNPILRSIPSSSFSSQPSTLDASFRPLPPLTPLRLLSLYLQLSKSRLTTLVVLSAAAGVSLSPCPSTLSTLLSLSAGTFLTSAAANAINQLFESPLDSQALRTRNRPLVTRAISPPHAAVFAIVCAVGGTALLAWGCNETTAALGAGNLVLYAFVYTPLKRLSMINTWVGAVVGAVPPLMGWTATGGGLFPTKAQAEWLSLPSWFPTSRPDQFPVIQPYTPEEKTVVHNQEGWAPKIYHVNQRNTLIDQFTDPEGNELDFSIPPAWSYDYLASLYPDPTRPIQINALAPITLFLVLYSWQFPHFNPLSHLIRSAYASSSYRMPCVVNPRLNARVSLRHSLALFPICSFLAPISGMVGLGFAFTSLVPNYLFAKHALAFYRRPRDGEARRLFWTSLWYLPIVLGLMMAHKIDAGYWDWLRKEGWFEWALDIDWVAWIDRHWTGKWMREKFFPDDLPTHEVVRRYMILRDQKEKKRLVDQYEREIRKERGLDSI